MAYDKQKIEQCSICLGDCIIGEYVRNCPSMSSEKCNAVFHNLCLIPWLRDTRNCPVCRRPGATIQIAPMFQPPPPPYPPPPPPSRV